MEKSFSGRILRASAGAAISLSFFLVDGDVATENKFVAVSCGGEAAGDGACKNVLKVKHNDSISTYDVSCDEVATKARPYSLLSFLLGGKERLRRAPPREPRQKEDPLLEAVLKTRLILKQTPLSTVRGQIPPLSVGIPAQSPKEHKEEQLTLPPSTLRGNTSSLVPNSLPLSGDHEEEGNQLAAIMEETPPPLVEEEMEVLDNLVVKLKERNVATKSFLELLRQASRSVWCNDGKPITLKTVRDSDFTDVVNMFNHTTCRERLKRYVEYLKSAFVDYWDHRRKKNDPVKPVVYIDKLKTCESEMRSTENFAKLLDPLLRLDVARHLESGERTEAERPLRRRLERPGDTLCIRALFDLPAGPGNDDARGKFLDQLFGLLAKISAEE